MITLFRRIRQNLIESGSLIKYLLYAIGEILLVVVGILIALQVDTWNTERENRVLEQQMLMNLRDEIRTNQRELKRDNDLNTQSLDAWYQLLDANRVNYSPEKTDSLIGHAFNFATFDARTGVIDEIIASGSLKLIKDEKLKFMISQWSGELNDLREDVVIRRDFWVNVVQPLFQTYIPTRNSERTQVRSDYNREIKVEPIHVDRQNYERFFNSLEVDGAIYTSYLNQSFVHTNETNIAADLDEFLEIVEANIHD
ncbi:MAG: hypothetical protein R3283_04515 [Balneolaceae bacterium]|nr:hypothetical protein [Balneolaceae bacterium]